MFDFSNEPGRKLIKSTSKKQADMAGELPLVSVVTPYYNADEYFKQTYNCVINQTLENFEWIIIDDGSHEKSSQYLQSVIEGEQRIKLIRQENRGQACARNVGIKNAKADIIVTLDADDLIEDYFLELNYKALQQHPQAAWSYTDSVAFFEQEYIWAVPFSAGRLTVGNFLVSTAAFRKSALQKVGYYSELEDYYDEDWAFFLKLCSENLIPIHIRNVGFWYRRHSSGMSSKVKQNERLRKKSNQYINGLTKDVIIDLACIEFEYGRAFEYKWSDKLIGVITKKKMGVFIFRMLFTLRNHIKHRKGLRDG